MNLFARSICLLALAACSKHNDCVPAPIHGVGLAGNWQLVHRQCYCTPGSTPNESASFTANVFAFYRDNQLVSSGTYAAATANLCGLPNPVPGLRLTYADRNLLPINVGLSLRGDTLVLDHGGPCDAAVDTYQRVAQ